MVSAFYSRHPRITSHDTATLRYFYNVRKNPHREQQLQQVLRFLQLVECGRVGGAHDVENAAREVQHGRWSRGLQARATQQKVWGVGVDVGKHVGERDEHHKRS